MPDVSNYDIERLRADWDTLGQLIRLHFEKIDKEVTHLRDEVHDLDKGKASVTDTNKIERRVDKIADSVVELKEDLIRLEHLRDLEKRMDKHEDVMQGLADAVAAIRSDQRANTIKLGFVMSGLLMALQFGASLIKGWIK